jgi:hypothetical protein
MITADWIWTSKTGVYRKWGNNTITKKRSGNLALYGCIM